VARAFVKQRRAARDQRNLREGSAPARAKTLRAASVAASRPRVEPGPEGLAKLHRLNRFVSFDSCAIFTNPILRIREGKDMKNAFFVIGLTITLGIPPTLAGNSEATRSVTIYHSPEMNLEEVDRQLLDQVGNGSTINFAAFILSDYKIMDSIRGAADRGAKIRIYLDPKEIWTQRFTEKHPFVKLWRTRGVDIKIKAVDDGLMHLKAYSISNVILRTGSANDSVSGLERHDNDILVITDKVAVESFNRKFESMWSRTTNAAFEFHD
jgi:phosphatidylserine/phosphatidylglycerophosphate/cardiolipin synthase-like enzyme